MAAPGRQAVKRSVTIDADVDEQAHALVGERGFSALVNDVLRRELQHQRLWQWLAQREAELGPIPEEATAWAEQAWKDSHPNES